MRRVLLLMSTPPPAPTDNAFDVFGLDPRIVQAITGLGFETPTPIQVAAMPPLLEGKDMIGRARTGSGKTAAFGLPLLERVKDGGKTVRALVLAPTRELAIQVTDALRDFAKALPVRVVTIYGGAPYGPQLGALRSGVSIVVGTPGRVIDHLERGSLDLSSLEVLVLDEADEMLRMGFLEDVQKVFDAAPPTRQVALFSATMPDAIRVVAEERLRDPVVVQVERSALTVDHIEHRALLVPERFKLDALTRLLAAEPIVAALVFVRTRAGCAAAADELARRGLSVDALHGDLNQAARERVLTRFRAKRLKVVIATDVAARGIDVLHISHVINFDLPTDAEGYTHRVGRTGRAGRKGLAISLVTPREVPRLRFFQRALAVRIQRVEVPSDAEIASAERERLLAELRDEKERNTSSGLDAMLDQLIGDGDARGVAAAALRLLASQRGLTLDVEPDSSPPSWARRAPVASRANEPSGDEIELFLPVGSKRGVRPADLVGALANDAGIPGASIGRVTILDHKSFVRISREAAEEVLANHHQLELRGRMVPIARARPRGTPPGDRPEARSWRSRSKATRNEKLRPKKRWHRKK